MYGTRFSKYKFKQSSAFINYAKFSISCLGPQLWNRILLEIERNISNLLIFKIRVKEKFLSTDNELDYFQIQEIIKKRPEDNARIHFALKDAWFK